RAPRGAHVGVHLHYGVVQVRRLGSGLGALGWTLVLSQGGALAAEPMSPAAQRELIDKYCMDCHNYTDYAGGVEFEIFDPGAAHESAPIAEKMLRKLRAGMMPPAGKPRPDLETVRAFATTMAQEI